MKSRGIGYAAIFASAGAVVAHWQDHNVTAFLLLGHGVITALVSISVSIRELASKK